MSEQDWKSDGPNHTWPSSTEVDGRRAPFCSRAGGSSIFFTGELRVPTSGRVFKEWAGSYRIADACSTVQEHRHGTENPSAASSYPEIR